MNAAGLLGGIGLFVAYVAVVMAALRLSSREPAGLVILAAAFVYAIGLPLLAAIGIPVNVWYLTVVYGFLALSFLMVFGAVYKSLSLRMLLDLLQARGHALDERHLAERYIKAQSFHDRLVVMVEKGLAQRMGARIGLSARGRRVAGAARALQTLYRIEKSG